MTNNPTIDGVSRELLERVCGIRHKSYDIEDAMQAGSELRSFLAITAADEQVDLVPSDNADQAFLLMDFALSFALCNTDHGGTRRDVKKAQMHLSALKDHTAVLQSTIARLEARIAELESGRGEPVAYISETSLSFLHQRKEIANTSWRLNLATHVSGDETQPLFATNFNLPFAEKIISKLRRCEECFSDFESGGVDIGRHWLDLLTQLGLLNRVQRSPAMWEITQQGEDCLDATAALNGVKP